jgi:MYXO-CTERM domain-containing protein
MGAATIKALAVAAVLMLAVPGPGLATAAEARSADTMPTSEVPAPRRDRQSRDEPTGKDSAAPSYHAFSTLGALALGVLGLLWVRRHTADL